MRHRRIHSYLQVDLAAVGAMVEDDLGPLRSGIERLLAC